MFNRNKKEEIEEKELSLEEIKEENKVYYTQLTNKNEDYMFQLNSRLEEEDYDPVKKTYVFNDMLSEIITAQESHIPARRIYGTVTEQTENILGKNVNLPEGEMERSPTWMLYMDGALLMGGLFGIVNGIATMSSTGDSVGLLQILMNFFIGGLAALVLTKYAPKPGQKKGFLKYILATVGVVFGWVMLLAVVLTLIPDVLNPELPGQLILGIAVVSLAARWYLKKKLDIQGTII